MIIIAVELLMEIKVWEGSVLNPVNFMSISLLEYGLRKSPNNNTLRLLLMRITGKLGLTSKYTGVSQNIKNLADENFEKFGAMKYSHYQSFGTERELEATCARYEKYYSEALTKNKSALTNGFKNREFQQLNELLAKNERLESAFFLTVC